MTAALAARPHSHRKPRRPGLLARWRTWREQQTRRQILGHRTVDIELARHGAQMARVEHHEPSPAVAAACAVTALTVAAADAVSVPPVRVGEPGPVATGPLPAAMADVDGDRPWEYPTGQFTALIDQMQLPARRADTF